VWGHIKKSSGAWALSPFRLANESKVQNQANMVALGRPGVGEELLARHGFEDVTRMSVPFAWEFADPESYARTLASTGPAYEAIQAVGEEEFLRWATEMSREHVRDGLPLRAEIDVVGYLARAPEQSASPSTVIDWKGAGFLGPAADTRAARAYLEEDVEDLGYVMNGSRVWAHLPGEVEALFELMGRAKSVASLSMRQRAILVSATASTMGDSYCSLAWGQKLANKADPDLAASVLAGTDVTLAPAEHALATWARRVTSDPNGTTEADLDGLREAGYDDAQILAITLFISLRIAFSTVNDALGARPDRDLADNVPPQVRDVVTWGRPVAE
jgi:uncharacterized peroxidase-related enzyme